MDFSFSHFSILVNTYISNIQAEKRDMWQLQNNWTRIRQSFSIFLSSTRDKEALLVQIGSDSQNYNQQNNINTKVLTGSKLDENKRSYKIQQEIIH